MDNRQEQKRLKWLKEEAHRLEILAKKFDTFSDEWVELIIRRDELLDEYEDLL